MKTYLGLGLASLVAISCGGSSKGGAAATPSSAAAASSQLSMMTVADGSTPSSKVTISGPTYGVFDSASGAFHVFVLDGSGGPAPDCDHLKELASGQVKARVVDLYLNKNVTAPGKVDAAGALEVDATGATPQMEQGDIGGVSLDFKSIDGKSFDADVVSASGSASGSLHGTICDSSKLRGGGDAPGNAAAFGDAPTSNDDAPSFQVALDNSISVIESSKALVKLDSKTKTLLIGSWTPNLPPPSCDLLATPAKSPGQSGTITLLYAKDVAKNGAGKYGVFGVQQIVVGDPSETKPEVATLDGTIDIHQFDDKTFAADLTASDRTTLSGNVAGTICPSGHIDVPGQLKTAQPGKKKKKKK